jgi:hypothetical protein
MGLGAPSKQMKLGAPLLAEFARSGDFRQSEVEGMSLVIYAFTVSAGACESLWFSPPYRRSRF